MSRRRPPALAGVVLGLLGLVLTLFAASPAVAASYRYWSFWDGANARWAYATQGPSTARPADGSVIGFRFSVSKDAAAEAAQPRAAADFAAVCADTAPAAGKKRVALVIDFGVPEDAPAGERLPQDAPRAVCAQVAPAGTAAEALAEVAKPLRYNASAMLCGISGFPRAGCGEPVADSGAGSAAATAPAASGTPAAQGPPPAAGDARDSGPSVGLVAGIAAIAALAAAGVLRSRRRRR
ncbi:SCO2322 family protein [Streptomyces sp. NPDC058623]|uniref:SCO2322 family protein n=1 Tax=Streptomyces sp. NPDC058623 TaxID=3346563 RepID=UPI0036652E5E